MLVSAVITTHKREPKIVERALKSILNQTHKEIEVFVVDDSPADYAQRENVASMVKKYQDMGVTYIPHEECKGSCAARNTGLAAAKGEFIGFLDDDDEWLPEKIEKQLKGFVNEKIVLVYCGFKIIEEGKERICSAKKVPSNLYEELLCENFVGSTSFPLIKTQALRDIDGFDIELLALQDYDVWLRLSKIGEFNLIDIPLVSYYFHGGEQISTNPLKRISGLERVYAKNLEYLKTHRKVKAIRIFSAVPFYASGGFYFKAITKWFIAFLNFPFSKGLGFRTLRSIIGSIIYSKK